MLTSLPTTTSPIEGGILTRRTDTRHPIKCRWRDYRSEMGRRPVKDFIDGLNDVDAAAMKDVREQGLVAGRHLRNDIYEVRVNGNKQIFRILFAEEGVHGQIVLSLNGLKRSYVLSPRT